MKFPVMQGRIERRVLVNFRVDPEVLQRHLPPPFVVQQVAGHGVAGVCLIRLGQLRPAGWPRWLGLRSENAAHRIAVTWPTAEGPQSGVFVRRRDTSSRLNTWVGGRVFPVPCHLADFDVAETATSVAIALRSRDRTTTISVRGQLVDALPNTSVFPDLATASRFFEAGALGCSPGAHGGCFDRVELRSHGWHVRPLAVEHVASSWLDDPSCFPAGSWQFDSALHMANLEHEWHVHDPLRFTSATAAASTADAMRPRR